MTAPTNVVPRVLVVLLSLGLLGACEIKTSDQRGDLVRALKGANVDGYFFATSEDDTQVVTSLTNGSVRSLIKLDSDKTVVLRYTGVTDKKARTTRTYRTEVIRAGRSVTAAAIDVASNDVVSKHTFPVPPPRGGECQGPKFASASACIQDFDCKQRGPLQCAANETCENQFAALDCCLTNGDWISVHLVISPTAWKCRLGSLFPDLDGLVVSP